MRLCWPQLLTLLLVAVMGSASMLSACGQKGDLYLPDEPPSGQPQKDPAQDPEKRPKG